MSISEEDDSDFGLGPAGSVEGTNPGQFIGGERLEESPLVAQEEFVASTVEELDQGQSTDVLDIADLEEVLAGTDDKSGRPLRPLPGLTEARSPSTPADAGPSGLQQSSQESPALPPPTMVESGAELGTPLAEVPTAPPKQRNIKAIVAGLVILAGAAAGALLLGGGQDKGGQATKSTEKQRSAIKAPAQKAETNAPTEATETASATAPSTANVESEQKMVEEPLGPPLVSSTPSGANVFVDGVSVGQTPIQIEPGSHHIAILLAGYEMQEFEESTGPLKLELQEAEAFSGGGGIKVRCREKDRYRVFLDGKDTGALCPTDRLGVGLGSHSIVIYDPVTKERKSFDATVEDTKRSLRVSVD